MRTNRCNQIIIEVTMEATDEEAPPLMEPLVPNNNNNSDSIEYAENASLILRRSATNNTSQLAIVGAKLCPIESLDYEIFENEWFKQDWRSQGKAEILEYICLKWTLCFLVGLIVGLVGFFNNLAVENIAGFKFVLTSNMMFSAKYGRAFAIFAVSNLLLTLFSSIITASISPAAAGSGIPEVKAYLNGVDAPAIFSFKTLLVKIIGNIAAVSSSLYVGKAGPLVHTGACIAALLGQAGSKNYGLTWRWLRFFQNDRDRRDLVTCGSAAGIAAAFRAPVGGVLFALEEMASWWRSALLWRTFFTTAVVAIVLRALIDICESGKCGLFGKGGLIMFDVTSKNAAYRFSDVPVVLVVGVLGGLLGSFYNFILRKVLHTYSLINGKGRAHKLFLACSVNIFTSCLLFGLPWLARCRACPSDSSEACPTIGRSGNYKKYQCPPGHYNDLASLFFNTNDDAIKNLFSNYTDDEFHHLSILMFFISSYFLGILSYGIVAPVGLFVPVIVAGASYGRYVGILLGSFTSLNHGLFAVLGSASLLGGSMRITVSSCVILLELTNNLLLLPLIMLVLLVSKTVADTFNGNIYDIIMKMKGFPYLEAHAEPYMRQLEVSDVVRGPLQVFNGIEKVCNIVHVLQTTGHNGFPVIDEHPSDSPVLFGIVLRIHLMVLLRKKAFVGTPLASDFHTLKLFSAHDFAKPGLYSQKIEDVELSVEEMELFIDLHPITNTSPYTVVETMSLAKACMLFRETGLRHLLVVPRTSSKSPVVGILTRHDFMPEHILGLHPFHEKSKQKRLRFALPCFSKLFKASQRSSGGSGLPL